MKPQETVDFNIKAAWHAIFRMYNTEAAKHDISTAIGFVLINIDLKEGTPATKIGPMMGMEIHSLSRMLKKMEGRGLIIKRGDPNDRRILRIFLTPLGEQKREISRKTIIHFNDRVKEIIPEKKLTGFLEVLNNITRLIENEKVFANSYSK
jgi:MarR family transcriptional regulator, organic hydroperoxide resistance regulator